MLLLCKPLFFVGHEISKVGHEAFSRRLTRCQHSLTPKSIRLRTLAVESSVDCAAVVEVAGEVPLVVDGTWAGGGARAGPELGAAPAVEALEAGAVDAVAVGPLRLAPGGT